MGPSIGEGRSFNIPSLNPRFSRSYRPRGWAQVRRNGWQRGQRRHQGTEPRALAFMDTFIQRKGLGYENQGIPRFGFFFHFLAMCLWASRFTSLNLCPRLLKKAIHIDLHACCVDWMPSHVEPVMARSRAYEWTPINGTCLPEKILTGFLTI